MYINLTVLCLEVDGLYPAIEMAGISPYLLLKLHSKGMDDFQIAEHLNCTPGTIIRKRRLLGLPNITHNYQSAHLQKEFSDLILSYYDKGYSDIKIVKRMHKDGIDVSLSIIKHWRKINKLPEANKKIIEPHEVKGEESLFCNTEFLESYFKKPLSKKECV